MSFARVCVHSQFRERRYSRGVRGAMPQRPQGDEAIVERLASLATTFRLADVLANAQQYLNSSAIGIVLNMSFSIS
jgi:hypothetical protein